MGVVDVLERRRGDSLWEWVAINDRRKHDVNGDNVDNLIEFTHNTNYFGQLFSLSSVMIGTSSEHRLLS